MYKNGFLPHVGGWLDQANKYIDMMLFIDQLVERHQAEQEVKHGKKSINN